MSAAAEAVIREVLGCERAGFVATRNALERELRAAGDDEAADRVAALRKPSVALWALIRVARDSPDVLEELATSIGRVRTALGGEGDPREAQEALQQSLRATVQEAESLAADAGERVTRATADRITAVLRAAIASETVLELLRAGLLVEEPEAEGGFTAIEGVQPRAKRRSEPRGPSAHERRKLERELRTLERKVDAARRRAADAGAEARAAADEAAAAEAEAEELAAELDRARGAV